MSEVTDLMSPSGKYVACRGVANDESGKNIQFFLSVPEAKRAENRLATGEECIVEVQSGQIVGKLREEV